MSTGSASSANCLFQHVSWNPKSPLN